MSKEAMREALEALEWMRVAFKPNTQGRQVADSAINALRDALGPETLEFEILDKYDKVIYDTTQTLKELLPMRIREIKESLSIEELAAISDQALDDAYHYGKSTPGKNFGWLANLESAKAALNLIKQGATNIDMIADAVHSGWNITAMADYNGELELDTPTPDEKKLKRYKLAQQSYAELSEEEKEKDRVVARALLKKLKGI